MNSAIRRHHYRRLQKKRKGYWYSIDGRKLSAAELGIVVATPQPCSCRGCGNPRKHENQKTMQERRKFQNDQTS